jgi:hypothetical protein
LGAAHALIQLDHQSMPWTILHQVGCGPGIGECLACRGHAEVQETGQRPRKGRVGGGVSGASQRALARKGQVSRGAGVSTRRQGPGGDH